MTESDISLDDEIAITASLMIGKDLCDLKSEKTPLPYGIAMRYRSYVPSRSPQDILDVEKSAYWFWYAAILKEYVEVLENTEKVPFVEKRRWVQSVPNIRS